MVVEILEVVEEVEGTANGETTVHTTVIMGTGGTNVSMEIGAESMRMIIAMSTTDP
jgi:hypothetical protein